MSRNRRGEKVEGGWIGEGEVGGEKAKGCIERWRGGGERGSLWEGETLRGRGARKREDGGGEGGWGECGMETHYRDGWLCIYPRVHLESPTP